jgi:hypothetical protein
VTDAARIATAFQIARETYKSMDTRETSRPGVDEVDLMLANARLRDELEPYRDESIDGTSTNRMSLRTENEYLESMLAWERAPALSIANWFTPKLEIPAPDRLTDRELAVALDDTIDRLFSQRVVLRYTDHLSDRELYTILYRDVLPCCEKKVDFPGKCLEWRCVENNETWMRYYATAVDRRRYQEEHEADIPPSETPKHKRSLPG